MTSPEVTRRVPERRELAYAVLLCLAGAGLALWAVTRTWVVDATTVSALDEEGTGGRLLPWLPALALVGLAGGGAVLATGGALRRLLGGFLALLGLALLGGGGYGLVADLGDQVSRQWPLLTLLGGLMAVVGGALTALRGNRWPTMSARYERRSRRSVDTSGRIEGAGTVEAWEALDRGEDPTVR